MEYREFLAAEDKQFRAHLEEHQRVIGGVLEEVKAQGERIAVETAQTVKASGREAVAQVQTSLEQVAQAAHQVGELAQRASKATEEAAQRSEGLLGRMDQASQRMVSSEQAVEGALNALLPKVGAIREGLEKELGDSVRAAAAMEDEVKKMVGSIRSSLTKEMESEIRTKLLQAANDASQRLYDIAEWWSWFSRVGTHVILIVVALSTGIAGWWFGQHQMKKEARSEALQEVADSLTARTMVYQVVKTSDGQIRVEETKGGLMAPLVLQEGGSVAPMKQGRDGKWYWGAVNWEPKAVPVIRVWDGKTGRFLKDVSPE